MSKRMFEFSEGTSQKFWEIWVDGSEVRTRYGKIGSAGQVTVKDEGTDEKAQKLYDKLVREKTGKGYVETTGGASAPAAAPAKAAPAKATPAKATPAKAAPAKTAKAAKADADDDADDEATDTADFKAAWQAVASAKDLPKALAAHLDFLCDTPACKKVLKALCATATEASSSASALTVVFKSPDGTDLEGEEWTLEASPPFTGTFAKNVPASHRRFCQHHNGMSLDGPDIPLGFSGVSAKGALEGGGFEDDYLEEGDPDVYEAFNEAGVPIIDPIGHHQDFVLYNFLKKTKLGEPALQFMSHEGGGLEPPYDLSLGITGVFLRLLAKDVLGDDSMLKTEEADDDEEDDDEDEDEDEDENEDENEGEDGEGGGTRRFEFTEDGAGKFWEISVDGSSHTVRYGKIGSAGQEKTKDFDDDDAAAADAAKLIAEKTKKGYVEADD